MGLHSPDGEFATDGTILIPEQGKLLRCFESQHHDIHLLIPSPEPVDSHGGHDISDNNGSTPFPIMNQGENSVLIDVQRVTFGASYNLTNLTSQTLQQGETWNVYIPQFDDNQTIQNIAWLEPLSDRWVLHVVTHCIAPEDCEGGDI